MAKEKKPLIGGQLLLIVIVLALSLPLGFAAAHAITPFLWWMEVQIRLPLTDSTGPAWFVILISILFTWGVFYTITGMVIEHRRLAR